MEKVVFSVHVIANLPVWFPAAYQGKSRRKSYVDCVGGLIAPCPRCWYISDLVSVIESPDFVGKVKLYSLECVSDFVSSRSIGNSWELTFKTWPFVDDSVVFGDSEISPVWYFDHFLHFSELHKRIVVNSKYCMLDNCERFQAVSAEMNFTSFSTAVGVVITA